MVVIAGMTVLHIVLIGLAGVVAGVLTAAVGNGTLVAFPTLVLCGIAPISANISTTLGLIPGSVSSAVALRADLTGQRARLLRLGAATALGSLVGACLLLVLPAASFRAVTPVLIALALALVVVQPWLTKRLRKRGSARSPDHGAALPLIVFAVGVYGGFFGGGQGIIYLALLAILVPESWQRVNGAKVMLVLVANVLAGATFCIADLAVRRPAGPSIAWIAVALLAVGSTVGGAIGAKLGRRLPPLALRTLIVVVGCGGIVRSVLG